MICLLQDPSVAQARQAAPAGLEEYNPFTDANTVSSSHSQNEHSDNKLSVYRLYLKHWEFRDETYWTVAGFRGSTTRMHAPPGEGMVVYMVNMLTGAVRIHSHLIIYLLLSLYMRTNSLIWLVLQQLLDLSIILVELFYFFNSLLNYFNNLLQVHIHISLVFLVYFVVTALLYR